jgi:hypothetical protein
MLGMQRSAASFLVLMQGLKPSSFAAFTARLKSCPDTKRFFDFGSKQATQDIIFAGIHKAQSLAMKRFLRWTEEAAEKRLIVLIVSTLISFFDLGEGHWEVLLGFSHGQDAAAGPRDTSA